MSQAQAMLLMQSDPLVFAKALWPEVEFYDRQREIIYSIRDNDETFCVAGNMLGKDYVAGFICLGAFLSPITFLGPPKDPDDTSVRIVTTSVKDDHLRVLWGEMDRFIKTSRIPLLSDKGGPLIYNHREIRKVVKRELVKHSYLIGQVSEKGEGMSGHHASWTLAVGDEASGMEDVVYNHMSEWARRKFFFGNPHPCQNFFRKGVDGGDLEGNDVNPDHVR